MKKFKFISVILASLLLVLSLSACGSKTQQNVSGPTETNKGMGASNQKSEVIRISAISLESPQKMMGSYSQLVDYLSKKTGKKVEFVPQPGNDKIMDAIKNNSVDIVSLSPTTYVSAHDMYGVETLARVMENGKNTYDFVLFVREDSPIKETKDLAGKKIATLMSYPALSLLEQNGIKKSDLSELRLFSSQDEVIMSVMSKDYDAGAAKGSIFEKNKSKGLREVVRGSLPTYVFAARSGLDANTKEMIKNALLELKDEQILKSIDKSYTGFTTVNDSDYQSIRDGMHKLGSM